MIVDGLESREADGRVERSARVRWSGGERRVTFAAAPDALAAPQDATPFLAAALLPAMCVHEDLEVDAPVSARMLARVDEIQAAYHSWHPGLRRARVRAEGSSPPGPPAAGVGCFFSRGVDSTYSALRERPEPPAVTCLVFCETLDPIHDATVRAEEARLAEEAAALLGLPLLRVASDVRALSEPLVNWQDAHGAGLAALAHALSGALGRAIVPSTLHFANVGPYGSSPLLDPLFSSERVDVVHDSIAGDRTEKVAAIAARQPELLSYLKVCYSENRPDNCGRCGKCLHTMVGLHAAGVLDRADGFPDAIDPDLVRGLEVQPLSAMIDWAQAARRLAPRDPVRAAILHALRRSARPSLRRRAIVLGRRLRGRRTQAAATWRDPPGTFGERASNVAYALLRDGRPEPPLDS